MKAHLNRSHFTTVRSQIATAAGCWFVLALFVGEMRLLGLIPAPAISGIFLTLAAAMLGVWRWSDRFRVWLNEFDIRLLVAPHLVRFAGIYFVLSHKDGQAQGTFASLAGWGEVWAAATAFAIIFLPLRRTMFRWVVLVWNLAALLNTIALTGLTLLSPLNGLNAVEAIRRLPLSLLPTFIMPILVFTHILIFTRLSGPSNQTLAKEV